MNEETHQLPIEPDLEARIVALVLGEASDFETEELERLIKSRPELAAFKREMEEVSSLLREVGAGEELPGSDWGLPSERRQVVLDAIQGKVATAANDASEAVVSEPSRFRRRRWISFAEAVVATAIIAVMIGLLLPATQMARESARRLAKTEAIANESGVAKSADIAPAFEPMADAATSSASESSYGFFLGTEGRKSGSLAVDSQQDPTSVLSQIQDSLAAQLPPSNPDSVRFSLPPASGAPATNAPQPNVTFDGSLQALTNSIDKNGQEWTDGGAFGMISDGSSNSMSYSVILPEPAVDPQLVVQPEIERFGRPGVSSNGSTALYSTPGVDSGKPGSVENLEGKPAGEVPLGLPALESYENGRGDYRQPAPADRSTPNVAGLALSERAEAAGAEPNTPSMPGQPLDDFSAKQNAPPSAAAPMISGYRNQTGDPANATLGNGQEDWSRGRDAAGLVETDAMAGEANLDKSIAPPGGPPSDTSGAPGGGGGRMGGGVGGGMGGSGGPPGGMKGRRGSRGGMDGSGGVGGGQFGVEGFAGGAPRSESGEAEGGDYIDRQSGQSNNGDAKDQPISGGKETAPSDSAEQGQIAPAKPQSAARGVDVDQPTDLKSELDVLTKELAEQEGETTRGDLLGLYDGSQNELLRKKYDRVPLLEEQKKEVVDEKPREKLAPPVETEFEAKNGYIILNDGRQQSQAEYDKLMDNAGGEPQKREGQAGDDSKKLKGFADREDAEDWEEPLAKSLETEERETVRRKSAFGRAPSNAPSAGLNETNATAEAFSTFSLHVSDVSFKLALDALARGQWPEAAKIRIEEFVNAFDYGDPLPCSDDKVACVVEQSIHPFIQQRNILRVSMRTSAEGRAQSTPLRLTLVLDNSGSMERIDRQQAVRRALSLLAQQLSPHDQVTLISFARQPRLLAENVPGAAAGKLVEMLGQLPSEGGTNIEAALKLAFEKANSQQAPGVQNRVVLLTDGAVNLGNADPESLSKMVESMRSAGIAFDAAGISAEGLNDEVLEALTRKGDGRYYLLDGEESSGGRFAQQIAGALRPSASNVKVQIEFNPRRVGQYKLLGFEKHILQQQDFRNDAVDAAEMAAAEAGVAVYQVEAKPDGEGDIGSVSVRFRDLATGQMVEQRWPIPYEPNATRPDQASASLRLATAAAMLAARLRGEPLGDTVDLRALSDLVAGLPEQQQLNPRVQELKLMIEQARQLSQQ